MRIAIPDIVSNSYFVALTAIVAGHFADEGLEMGFEHIYPADKAFAALGDGKVEFVAASAHGALPIYAEGHGVKLLAALAQGMYWFLVMRSDLGIARGDVGAVKGRSIGAAPVVRLGLLRLLAEAGIDVERDGVTIASIPRTTEPNVSFGVTAAKALEAGLVDGFWANGMAAETAVRGGYGTVVLDVRRGDGPPQAFRYTFPCLATSDEMVEREPARVAAAVRAIVRAQRALSEDAGLAATVGHKLFSAAEAAMIGDVVARDIPYFDAAITEKAVDGLNRFARAMGLMTGTLPYERAVATRFSHLWRD